MYIRTGIHFRIEWTREFQTASFEETLQNHNQTMRDTAIYSDNTYVANDNNITHHTCHTRQIIALAHRPLLSHKSFLIFISRISTFPRAYSSLWRHQKALDGSRSRTDPEVLNLWRKTSHPLVYTFYQTKEDTFKHIITVQSKLERSVMIHNNTSIIV